MVTALKKLKTYCDQQGINVYLIIMPDIHNLTDYPFDFIHARMSIISEKLGYNSVDLLPAFEGLAPEDIWAMPGDPHPNALGHQRVAEFLFPILQNPPPPSY